MSQIPPIRFCLVQKGAKAPFAVNQEKNGAILVTEVTPPPNQLAQLIRGDRVIGIQSLFAARAISQPSAEQGVGRLTQEQAQTIAQKEAQKKSLLDGYERGEKKLACDLTKKKCGKIINKSDAVLVWYWRPTADVGVNENLGVGRTAKSITVDQLVIQEY